jgi:hypothetical protein
MCKNANFLPHQSHAVNLWWFRSSPFGFHPYPRHLPQPSDPHVLYFTGRRRHQHAGSSYVQHTCNLQSWFFITECISDETIQPNHSFMQERTEYEPYIYQYGQSCRKVREVLQQCRKVLLWSRDITQQYRVRLQQCRDMLQSCRVRLQQCRIRLQRCCDMFQQCRIRLEQ